MVKRPRQIRLEHRRSKLGDQVKQTELVTLPVQPQIPSATGESGALVRLVVGMINQLVIQMVIDLRSLMETMDRQDRKLRKLEKRQARIEATLAASQGSREARGSHLVLVTSGQVGHG